MNKSPMRQVFEACTGREELQISRPPARPLIRAWQLLAEAQARKSGDKHFEYAKESFLQGIKVAMEDVSIRSCGVLRLSLVAFLINRRQRTKPLEDEIAVHLDWVLQNCQAFAPLLEQANCLKQRMDVDTVKQVVDAMKDRMGGYDYGGSWSSHWYECPNGHPYFIGECGGAMEVAFCTDCGAPVGGTAHNLLSTNRQARNLV